jgi:N6-adenosine-specific RNA methylase IME4
MKQFSIIICDPAWKFSDKLAMSDVPRGADANYKTMSSQDIINLDVKSIADPNGCVLALWVPSSILQTGLDVMKAWGFTQKQTFVYIKVKNNKSLGKLLGKITNYLPIVENISETVKYFVGDALLGFGMGKLFRSSHEICLIGINTTKIYKKLQNKSQRSVCFAENQGHSIKPENLHRSLELMFPGNDINRLEMFARRPVKGWTTIGNQVCNGEDIRVSIEKLKND